MIIGMRPLGSLLSSARFVPKEVDFGEWIELLASNLNKLDANIVPSLNVMRQINHIQQNISDKLSS